MNILLNIFQKACLMHTNLCILIEISVKRTVICLTNGEFHFSIKLAQKTDHFSSISQQPYIHISDAQDIATKGIVPLDITLTNLEVLQWHFVKL